MDARRRAPERADEPASTWFDRVERATLGDETYRVLPSEAASSGLALPPLSVGATQPLHAPLALDAAPECAWSEVGDAIHAFLASDTEGVVDGASGDEQRERATRLLDGIGWSSAERVNAVLHAAESFRAWVAERFPGATWRREVPVRAKIEGRSGERELVGAIDLMLELPDGGVVVIDHKSDRVTDEGAWRARAAVHAPQLAAYTVALEAAGRRVVGRYVHFVVGGGVVELA